MNKTISAGCRLIVSSSLCLAGCGTPQPEIPFEIHEVSEYLCVGLDFADGVCRANLGLMDAQVEFVASSLGVDPPEECIPTLWTEDPLSYCGFHRGCYREGIIYSSWQAMPHELVHAVTGAAGVVGPPLIDEGIAEALSGKVLRHRARSVAELLEIGANGSTLGGTLGSAEYESFGHFVAWIRETYGDQRFMALYRRLRRDTDAQELGEELERTLGVPLSELSEAYSRASDRVYAGKGPFSCGAMLPALPWRGALAREDVIFHCDSREDFQRADRAQLLGHPLELWRGYTSELSGGQYWLEVDGPEKVAVVVEACLESDTTVPLLPSPPLPVVPSWGDWRSSGMFLWPEFPTDLVVPGGIELDLPAGAYTLWFGWIRDPRPDDGAPPTMSFAFEERTP